MRRGEIDQKVSAVMCGLAILLLAGGQVASQFRVTPIGPPAPAPVVVPDIPPAAEPAMVIVTDAAGKRIADEAIEAVAAKLAVGQWRVQAIPKPGDVGWLRWIVVSEPDKPLPVPVPPVPVPPGPTPVPVPPPVVSGKRELMIVRETADVTTPLSALLVKLRTGTAYDYLKSKGHTLSILDVDSVNENGQPSKLIEAWRPHLSGMVLPALFIIDAQTRQLIHKENIAPTATADNIIEQVREHGG